MIESFDDIMKRLVSEEDKFQVTVQLATGAPREISFASALQLDAADLNEYGRVIEDWQTLQGPPRRYLSKLHWLVRGILEFQDLMSLIDLEQVSAANDLAEMFCRHHCYYQGLVYLRAGLLSLVNMNSNAAITLLRPIFEQFVYSVYWDIVQQDPKGTSRYNAWLRKASGKPPFRGAIEEIGKHLAAQRPSIKRWVAILVAGMRDGYRALCTWSHTPAIDESFDTSGMGSLQGSLSDWFFCLHMYNAALANMVYLYVCQYPLALFPVDVIRKWGCRMPVGVYVDDYSAAVIKQALGPETAARLRTLLRSDDEVLAKLDHAGEASDLTDDEIWKTWEESENKPSGTRPKDLTALAGQQKAQIRSMGWAFNYIAKRKIDAELSDKEKAFFRNLYGSAESSEEL